MTACSANGGALTSTAVLQNPQANVDASDSYNGLQALADQLSQNGQYEAAIPIYRHLAAQSGDAVTKHALAESLMGFGAYNEAVQILASLAETLPDETPDSNTAEILHSFGKALLAMGRYEEALYAFDQAIYYGDATYSEKSHVARGITLAALGRIDEALSAFSLLNSESAHTNKALVLAANNHPDEAIEILEPLAEKGQVRDRQNLALAYLYAGQREEAFAVARLDLDNQTVAETFQFYETLAVFAPKERMQALISGTINPAWTRAEDANLVLPNDSAAQAGAARIIAEANVSDTPQILASVEPETTPELPAETTELINQANYTLTDIPPLLEPEGWALQIGAYRTIKRLQRGWTLLYRRSGDLLRDIEPRRSEVTFAEFQNNIDDADNAQNDSSSDSLKESKYQPHGFYYRLNAGPLASFQEAKTLCNALKGRGTPCWIRPPESSEGKLPTSAPEPETQIAQTVTDNK